MLEHEKASGWNEMLQAGFEKAAKKHGFENKTVIAPSGPEQQKLFSDAVSNADVAIVASDNLHEILRDNASKFRRVKFGSIDAGIRAANIMSVTFADEEAACLAGNAAAMLAGSLQNSNPAIGWLSGENSPSIRTLYNAFAECAKLANPNIGIAQRLASSPDDEAGAREKAIQLLKHGARVIVLAAGGGNRAAAKALETTDVWIIPLDDKLRQSNVMGWLWRRPDLAARDIINSASGVFRAKEIDIRNISDGYVSFELSKNLAEINPPLYKNILRRLDELRNAMANSELRLPSFRARTLCDCLD